MGLITKTLLSAPSHSRGQELSSHHSKSVEPGIHPLHLPVLGVPSKTLHA